jgi:hypothetical protein
MGKQSENLLIALRLQLALLCRHVQLPLCKGMKLFTHSSGAEVKNDVAVRPLSHTYL